MVKKLYTLLKFGIVGIINTGIDFSLFAILKNLGTSYIAAQCLSYGCGVLNSFLFNRSWTFKRNARINRQEIGKFLCVNIITLVVTSGFLVVLIQFAGWPMLISKCFATAVGIVVNFMGTRNWVFVEPKERGEQI
ncbi:GtrA family protein [Aneurinibacillus terranovensis]|uniref:GtrA family protein n=1 Tax=Aneurinibacillus terranovensis TaxID=278991 RepID=UPI0004809797|nr:GtrA family protein [Aneurinibacillus terranovensis]